MGAADLADAGVDFRKSDPKQTSDLEMTLIGKFDRENFYGAIFSTAVMLGG